MYRSVQLCFSFSPIPFNIHILPNDKALQSDCLIMEEEEAVPLLRRASSSFTFFSRSWIPPRAITSKYLLLPCLVLFTFPLLFWHRATLKDLSVPFPRPFPHPTLPQLLTSGSTPCLPPPTQSLIHHSLHRHTACRTYSPFTFSHTRIATATAHFGFSSLHYLPALRTHVLHSLIHSTSLHVLCDPIIDSLWNKPAFILHLLIHEMLKPAPQRLEWIMWVDRDTLVLDQCRPIASFLPPPNATDVNLLVTNDYNGLNNGVFIVRVSEWAVKLFTCVLAFRHFEPGVALPYTEQSAMEHVLATEDFRNQTRYVPQHWFNAYDYGGAAMYAVRKNGSEFGRERVRKGDYLVHFAGHPEKGAAIEEYEGWLEGGGDVWERGEVVRDVSGEVEEFWRGVGE